MRIYFSLLLLTTVNFVVGDQPKEVVFQPRMLIEELDAIRSYHTEQRNRDILIAYIHLPKSITFRVRTTGGPSLEKHILIVDGQFQLDENRSQIYDGLYYSFGDEQFYVKPSNGAPMKLVLPSKRLRYVQLIMEETKPYLSIRYFGVKELTQEMSSVFSGYKNYYISPIDELPATFLVTSPYGDGFLEYSFWTPHSKAREKKEVMKVLFGEETKNSVTIFDHDHGDDLVFHQNNGTLSVRGVRIKKGKIFGIRVKNAPSLAEVLESGITMFNSYDVDNGLSLAVDSRQLSSEDEELLKKVQRAGLKYPYYDLPSLCPKSVKFQVYGMILVKSVTYLSTDEVDKDCPFVVEFEDGNGNFAYRSVAVPKLCTNDTDFWPFKEHLITV